MSPQFTTTLTLIAAAFASPVNAADWPMFGGNPSRNMVNPLERNLPATWSVEAGKFKNIKWTADLGTRTFSTPVVAGGKVFVGTNNQKPRDPNMKEPKAVLMAFREADGMLLWQNLHNVPGEGTCGFFGTRCDFGLMSTPTVEGRYVYYVTPAAEVICADIDSGAIRWGCDMMQQLKVGPRECNTCSPLVVGDLVFVVTANGIDDDGEIRSPKAPSFVALDKKTGKLAWQSNLPGENIIEGQWSSPTFANVGGVPQVIFAGGDCVIYSFAPQTGKLLWKCDCLPTRKKKLETRLDVKTGKREFQFVKPGPEVDNYIVGTPVIAKERLFVGLGHPYELQMRHATSSYFLCLDITRSGDVSFKSYDAKAGENKGSALVWAFGGPIEDPPKKGRRVYFGSTTSTAAVHDGLAYITEQDGYLHCLDAATGKRPWQYDLEAAVWGSPYWVDGRVYVPCDDGAIRIFEHGRAAKLLATIDMDDMISATPVAANGVLYVTTRSKIYAIGSR